MCGKMIPADERQIAHSQLIITHRLGTHLLCLS